MLYYSDRIRIWWCGKRDNCLFGLQIIEAQTSEEATDVVRKKPIVVDDKDIKLELLLPVHGPFNNDKEAIKHYLKRYPQMEYSGVCPKSEY